MPDGYPATRPHHHDRREGVGVPGWRPSRTDTASRGLRRIADGHRRRGGVLDACQITAAFD